MIMPQPPPLPCDSARGARAPMRTSGGSQTMQTNMGANTLQGGPLGWRRARWHRCRFCTATRTSELCCKIPGLLHKRDRFAPVQKTGICKNHEASDSLLTRVTGGGLQCAVPHVSVPAQSTQDSIVRVGDVHVPPVGTEHAPCAPGPLAHVQARQRVRRKTPTCCACAGCRVGDDQFTKEDKGPCLLRLVSL